LLEISKCTRKKQVDTQRTYGQYCGLARSLDLIGDRWSLLVVRELLPGPRRYRDLAASLDGIASNLLTDRLRRLEAEGIVERRLAADGPVVYALTPWGAGLREPIEALVRWSAPTMATGVRDGDVFDPRWLAIAIPALLPPGRRSRRPAEIGVEVRGLVLAVRVDRDGVHVTPDPEQRPSTVVAGEPHVVLGLVAGMLGLDHPGLTIHGDADQVAAVFPGAA
jgi:DNA-binding HxlR family transcriptional regulator